MNYEVEFGHYRQIIDNIKEKDINILLATIAGARIGRTLKFNSFANMSFDDSDVLHRYGHVNSLASFDRRKTNCVVFNMIENELNNNRYDKLILYYHSTKSDSYYGYLLINTVTNKCTQVRDISGDINDIVLALNHTVYNLNLCDKYEKDLAAKRADPLFSHQR